MHIDKNLHIVIPVDCGEGKKVFVHSTPVSTDTFDTFFEEISVAMARLMEGGFGPYMAGNAHHMLRKVAKEKGTWETAEGAPGPVQVGLVNEIHRLTNVCVPTSHGGDLYQLDDAVKRKLITEEDLRPIEGNITFFTLAWRAHPPTIRRTIAEGGILMWGARIESLSCSEFLRSLPNLTADGNSGATGPASSVTSLSGSARRDSASSSGA